MRTIMVRIILFLGVCAGTFGPFATVAWAQEALAPKLHDLSFWGMVDHADWVVKGVLAGLTLASVLTWTVGLIKTAELCAAGRRIKAGLRIVTEAGSLGQAQTRLDKATGVCGALTQAALQEIEVAPPSSTQDAVKERVAWRLERIVARAGRVLSRGTGVLATIGATAPFVGLFGTVWGIMESFIGISRSQTTNLAVVAPGIAEALLATAIGLVAAIPAVVIYNLFARAMIVQRAGLADAVAGIMVLVSRDLDTRVKG